MFKLALVLGLLVVLSYADRGKEWNKFKSNNKKNYKGKDEENKRRKIWEDNLDFITKHNEEYKKGLQTYTVGENMYADLGLCGACWAFAALGALEGQWYKKYGKLIQLSEQNLVDCSIPFGKLYKSGVYNEVGCKTDTWFLNHAVLVVGYVSINATETQPYWIIKNSWGTAWGDNGFGKILRNNGNLCGIATVISYPIVG